MNPQDLERDLKRLKKEQTDSLPEPVQQQMNRVFASIRNGESLVLPTDIRSKLPFRRPRRFRTGSLLAGCVLFLILGLIGLGFVSPIVAQSLQSMPGIGGLFTLYGDPGLKAAEKQHLPKESGLSITHDGITLKIGGIVYDGTRIAMEVSREGGESLFEYVVTSELQTPLSLADIQIHYEDSYMSVGTIQAGDRSLILTTSLQSGQPKSELPDTFVLPVRFRLNGIDEPYTFRIPIKQNAEKTVYIPDVSKTFYGTQVTLEKIERTAVTTALTVRFSKVPSKDSAASNRSYPEIGGEVYGDDGRLYGLLIGEGTLLAASGDFLNQWTFEPLDASVRSLILKPYLRQPDGGKKYIKALEMTIPLNGTPSSSH